MIESETFALIAWYLASIRQREPFTKAQKAIWAELLDDTDPRDARSALDRMLETGEFVTPQRIGELAISTRFERIEAEGLSRPALPPERDDRPACCIEAEGSLTHWLETHATPEEIAAAKRRGVAKQMEASDAGS